MTNRQLSLFGVLAAFAAAGALFLVEGTTAEDPVALQDQGIGPLVVGRPFGRAERQAFRMVPESAFSGVGCAGLDEIRYDGWLGEHPVGVMAMAEEGRIREVEAMLYSPVQAADRQACMELRDDFAEPFLQRFGPYENRWEVSKPVSEELMARTGPVVVAARWFSMGRSCYISAHYGVLKDGSVRLGEALAAIDRGAP